jgi:hypothetical protein
MIRTGGDIAGTSARRGSAVATSPASPAKRTSPTTEKIQAIIAAIEPTPIEMRAIAHSGRVGWSRSRKEVAPPTSTKASIPRKPRHARWPKRRRRSPRAPLQAAKTLPMTAELESGALGGTVGVGAIGGGGGASGCADGGEEASTMEAAAAASAAARR